MDKFQENRIKFEKKKKKMHISNENICYKNASNKDPKIIKK